MMCSPSAANQIQSAQTGTAGAPYLMPAYQIDSQYAANVDNWIATYPQDSKNPITLTFDTTQSSSTNWQKMGFESSSVSVNASYCCFFSVTYTENKQRVTKNITAEEAGSSLSITMTATGMGTYKVSPAKWSVARRDMQDTPANLSTGTQAASGACPLSARQTHRCPSQPPT